jgi:hypothetical protein
MLAWWVLPIDAVGDVEMLDLELFVGPSFAAMIRAAVAWLQFVGDL